MSAITRHSVSICCISKAIDLISNNKSFSYKHHIFINKNIASLNLNTSAVPKKCKKKNNNLLLKKSQDTFLISMTRDRIKGNLTFI